MQYTQIFSAGKIENSIEYFYIFLIFAQNIHIDTHNLCFGAKIRKIGTPLHTQDYIKVGFKGSYILRTCFLDELHFNKVMILNTPPSYGTLLPYLQKYRFYTLSNMLF